MSTPEALARVRIDTMLRDAGWLVPQHTNDESASVLLERIRAERAAAPDKPKRGRAKGATQLPL